MFTASGVGGQTTPAFSLHGGTVMGGMAQHSAGATFRLLPEGGGGAPVPLGECLDTCASGGWSLRTSVPAGQYRLQVQADPDTSWTFDLQERLVLPLSLKVTEAAHTTSIDAHGLNAATTKPFEVKGKVGVDGFLRLTGSFQDEQATIVALVPAGQPFDPSTARAVSVPAYTGGGFSLQVTKPGMYYLLVRTTGHWQLQLLTAPPTT